jgi:hypothetical protein
MLASTPWLQIPAADYESHMSDVGQSAALRDLFSRVYAATRPARLAILGCTTGSDFAQVDPALTKVAAGLDINPQYIDIARTRWSGSDLTPHLIVGDVLEAELPAGTYDLVHAALLLEYVDPLALLARIHTWLSTDGACSLITQEPSTGLPAVSATRYESLRALAGQLTLRTADEVVSLANRAGFSETSRLALTLPGGKILVSTTFKRARSLAVLKRAT